MNNEILHIIEQLRDAFEGDPWYGRSLKALLSEVNEDIAFERPSGQHSILELVWHMVNWRAFTVACIAKDGTKPLSSFEENDWQVLDHADKSLWQKGLKDLYQSQEELVQLLQGLQDSILEETVPDRNYNFRKLFDGIVQHDVYHLGQIAYLTKLLKHQ